MQTSRVANFDSTTPEYTKAFHLFLSHTDQKEKTMEWLDREVEALPQRRIAIDAGAGTGKLTKWLAGRFARVIGVEPNPSLADEFRTACPMAILIPETILAAKPQVVADFILCSHVFYYIPRTEWEETIRQLISWLAPGGLLAIAIQNPSNDCTRMKHHFIPGGCDLRELAAVAESALGGSYDVRLDTVEAYIRTNDLQTACEVAEFILNVQPMPNPPLWADLEEYVSSRFLRSTGDYQFSCHQDFLRIARHR
jgi:trans-aconitate methyltransferase